MYGPLCVFVLVDSACLDQGFRLLFFFFQAEDGIRDIGVTEVQTCALPISPRSVWPSPAERAGRRHLALSAPAEAGPSLRPSIERVEEPRDVPRVGLAHAGEIGRASCRERV